jgi:catechol 2,3-dioxygenase-like lactoylglutathione lyase family enzyme
MNTARAPQLRIARPSRHLSTTTRFYTRALGLKVLGAFEDHDGFDGVMLGHEGWPYHLELTRRRHAPIAPRPTDEDLLVFYLSDEAEWHAAVQRVRDLGATAVKSSNPYWDARGVTFTDPDGYRFVLEHAAWP